MGYLKLSINATEEKNSFIVYDCTGIYRYDNLGGWGAPNPQIVKITSAVLFITPPNLAHGVQPYAIDVTGNFPNTDSAGMEVLPYQVGQVNNQLVSGKYLIKLDITGTDAKGAEYKTSAVCVKIFINNVSCCIDKLQKSINRDAYRDKSQQVKIDLNLMLMSARWAVECELYEQAAETIDFLNSQCTCIDC